MEPSAHGWRPAKPSSPPGSTWSGPTPSPPDLRADTAHLYPPRDDLAWRRRWHFAQLSHRHAGTWVRVRDARGPEVTELTLPADPLHALFGPRLNHPAPRTRGTAALLRQLSADRLVLLADGQASWLPYRVRRWPARPDP